MLRLLPLLLLSNPALARREFCGTAPAAGFEQPPNQARNGRYINTVYGYSVDIPSAFTGYVTGEGPDRGFGIVLSWTPRAFLRVDASYDALFDITAQGVHRSDVGAMRLHATVVDDLVAQLRVAHREGARSITRVQCDGNPQIFIHDDVIVMFNREIYRLDLQTVPERYAVDIKVLNTMLRSWRWEKIRSLQR